MNSASRERTDELPATPWGELPPRMRVLFIAGTARTAGWLAEAFAADMATAIELCEATGVAAGLAQLRDELFDAVLISHEGEGLDALALLDAVRAGSCDEQPIVVLGSQSSEEMTPLCYEAGADDYVCTLSTTTRTLIWKVARAVERHRLLAKNRRLENEHQHRLRIDQDEAIRLLGHQRGLLANVDRQRRESAEARGDLALEENDFSNCPNLPDSLVGHYRELLRAYVIMGSGNLSQELSRLADLLTSAAVTATQAMQLHLFVLEDVIRGLGSRSARHVTNRANLLVMELIVNLSEGYRDRFMRHERPPKQSSLLDLDLFEPASYGS